MCEIVSPPSWTLVILAVIFMCSSLQVAGEMFCVFNHVAVILVCLFFMVRKCLWLASIVRLILLVGVQMPMSCN